MTIFIVDIWFIWIFILEYLIDTLYYQSVVLNLYNSILLNHQYSIWIWIWLISILTYSNTFMRYLYEYWDQSIMSHQYKYYNFQIVWFWLSINLLNIDWEYIQSFNSFESNSHWMHWSDWIGSVIEHDHYESIC